MAHCGAGSQRDREGRDHPSSTPSDDGARRRRREHRVGVAAAPSQAGPITKQNGAKPAFDAFPSICSVPGYTDHGLCGGDVTKFANVKGKLNAIQAKLAATTSTSPGGLEFDLNTVLGEITIVTSWWSGQYVVVNADETLSWAGA